MARSDAILAKLDSLMRCVRRVESKRPTLASELADDLDAQDIISLNLERAVQLCVDAALLWLASEGRSAPPDMAGAFRALAAEGAIPQDLAERLVKAVGFRNVAVHQYRALDWRVVHAVAWNGLDDFRSFSGYLANLCGLGAAES